MTGASGLDDHRLTALLAALTALPALSIDMGLPALPDLAAGLDVGAAAAQLSIGLFLAGFALGQLALGLLADRFGRRPILLAGLGLFAAAGLGCALAPTLGALLVCRVAQGFGAAAGPVLARAVIRDLFSGAEAAARLAQAAAIMALAPMAAPALGVLILGCFGWRGIFAVLGLAGVGLWLLVAARLEETIPARDAQALAPRALARNAWTLLRCREAFGHGLAAACLFGGMFAWIAASPFALMARLGVGPAQYACLFALTALGIMAGSLAAPGLARRSGRQRTIRSGLTLGAASGLALLALAATAGPPSPAAVALPVLAYTFARGLVLPIAVAAAMEPMRATAGLASGLLGTLQMAAAALAACTVGLFADPLVGMAATLATFGAAACACGRIARDDAGLPAEGAAPDRGSVRGRLDGLRGGLRGPTRAAETQP